MYRQLILAAVIPGAYWVRFKIVDPVDDPIYYLVVGQAKYGWLEALTGGKQDLKVFVHTNMVERVER